MTMTASPAPRTKPAPQVSIEPKGVDGTYLSRLKSLLSQEPDIGWPLEAQRSDRTRISFSDNEGSYDIISPEHLIAQTADSRKKKSLGICVIENISAEFIEVLGKEWGIDQTFFVEHASNPAKADLWTQKDWHWSLPDWPETTTSQEISFLEDQYGHMDGVIEFHGVMPHLASSALEKRVSPRDCIRRHCVNDPKWGLQCNTRISYCRPDMGLYLFLVDAPITVPTDILEPKSPANLTMRFMYSDSRGGVELPRLLSASEVPHSIFENLKLFSQHKWHHRMLFVNEPTTQKGRFVVDPSHRVLPCHPMIYMLVSCLHRENLRYLAKEIKRISFKELRNPKLETNSELHDRREDLAGTKEGLIDTRSYIPPDVTAFFANHPEGGDSHSGRMTRTENLDTLIEQTTKLEAFLMETFQLFMSSVSVQDSRLSINQSRRSSQLTLLALIYIPLSFVTGIFGMNVQQINSSGLSIWVCFVTLVPIILLTVLIFLAVKFYGDRKAAKEKRADLSAV